MNDNFIALIYITFSVFILITALACVELFTTFVSVPDVYTSYSTGKCVKVEFQGKEIPCSDLKGYPRYTNIWVE